LSVALTIMKTREQIALIPYKARTNHILYDLNIFPNPKNIGLNTLFVHFEQLIGSYRPK